MSTSEPTAAAVLYAAKSTEDEHGSIPAQLADARAMAQREGWTVVDEYQDEKKSAWSGDRGPGLADAMANAERLADEHGTAMLVVQHSDRLARGDGRQARHLGELHFWALKASVQLRSVQDDSTFTNPLLVFAMGERNAEDSRRKAQSVADGMTRRKARGLHNGGPERYGYRYVRDAKGRPDPDEPLQPHPTEAKVIQRIFADTLVGVSQKQLARDLTNDGITTKQGGDWYQGLISKILRDRFYLGEILGPDEEWIDGQHPAIVNPATFDAVSAASTRRRRSGQSRGGRPTRRPVLFANGHLVCGRCGGPMSFRHHQRAGGYAWERYVCRTRDRDVTRCDQPPMKVQPVEQAVMYALADRADSVRDRAQRHLEAVQRDRQLTAGRLADAEIELRRAQAAVARVQRAMLDGHLDGANYAELKAMADEELAGAQAQADQLADREQRLSATLTASDVQDAVLVAFDEVRAAVADALADSQHIDRARELLRRIMPTITLRAFEDGYVLDPADPEPAVLAELIAADAATDDVGKPNPLMMRSALNALEAHSETTAMVGDRMDTDVVAGIESGLETVLVLSGITTRAEAERFPFRASQIVDSVADLVEGLG